MTNNKKKQTKKLSSGNRQILFVKWRDHCKRNNGSWINAEDRVMRPVSCEAVGFKVYEDKDVLVLALTQDDADMVGETMHLIKSCITKRRVLK